MFLVIFIKLKVSNVSVTALGVFYYAIKSIMGPKSGPERPGDTKMHVHSFLCFVGGHWEVKYLSSLLHGPSSCRRLLVGPIMRNTHAVSVGADATSGDSVNTNDASSSEKDLDDKAEIDEGSRPGKGAHRRRPSSGHDVKQASMNAMLSLGPAPGCWQRRNPGAHYGIRGGPACCSDVREVVKGDHSYRTTIKKLDIEQTIKYKKIKV